MGRNLRLALMAVLIVVIVGGCLGCVGGDSDADRVATRQASGGSESSESAYSASDYTSEVFEGYSFIYPSNWEQAETGERSLSVFPPRGDTFARLSLMDISDGLEGATATEEEIQFFANVFVEIVSGTSGLTAELKSYNIGSLSGYLFYHPCKIENEILKARTFITVEGGTMIAWTLADSNDANTWDKVFSSLKKVGDLSNDDASKSTDEHKGAANAKESFGGVSIALPSGWKQTQDNGGNSDIRTYRASDDSGYVAIDYLDIGKDLSKAYKLLGDKKQAIEYVLDAWSPAVEEELGLTGVVDSIVDDREAKVGSYGKYGMSFMAFADATHLVVVVADGPMDVVDSIIDSITFDNSMDSIEAAI